MKHCNCLLIREVVLGVLPVCCLLLSATASEMSQQPNGTPELVDGVWYYYQVRNGVATFVVDHHTTNETPRVLYIPSTLGGWPVTTIRNESFAGCDWLDSVIIPPTVKSIAFNSFAGSSLRSISIPEGVEEIGLGAFASCVRLTSVTIPASVRRIDDGAFAQCRMLMSVSVLSSETRIAKDAFDGTPSPYGRLRLEACVLSSVIRDTDPMIMDVEYIVICPTEKVRVRTLAFKDGVRSFVNVVRPETFVDGTEVNVGDEVEANVPHKLSWRVSSDCGTELMKLKFEVLAQEGDLLPMEWITIPASDSYGQMKVSYNEFSTSQWFDALMWLYATKDPELTLVGGTLKVGDRILAVGSYPQNPATAEFVYRKMHLSLLTGPVLTYARDETRKAIPFYCAYKLIDE